MNRLYAPWRTQYVINHKKDICVFCNIVKNPKQDEEFAVLFRAKNSYVVMNKYPYSPGHLMVIPNAHTNNTENLDDKTWIEMSLLVKQATKMLKEILNAQGVNIGMNINKAAGAGIEEHIHYHVLPRWIGDTNFITSIADTRVYPVDFNEIYKKLKSNALKYFI